MDKMDNAKILFDMIEKYIEEEKAGNLEFRTAKVSTRRALEEIKEKVPEVDDFMREFLEPYGNTLDELLD